MSQPATQLVAVVRAGPYRMAIPASAVLEVARLDPGHQELRDRPVVPLGPLLGLEASPSAWALRLDVADAPPLGVELVEGVLDAAAAPFFNLPSALGVMPPNLIRGVYEVGARLALELRPEVLVGLGAEPPRPGSGAQPHYATAPVDRALVVVVAGRSMGFPLPLVLSVLAGPAVSSVPRVLPGRRGVLLHSQTLCPVLDLGELLFGRPTPGDFGVVVDLDGVTWVVLADSVLGMRSGFRPAVEGQEGWMEGQRGEKALFPLFPSDAGGLTALPPS